MSGFGGGGFGLGSGHPGGFGTPGGNNTGGFGSPANAGGGFGSTQGTEEFGGPPSNSFRQQQLQGNPSSFGSSPNFVANTPTGGGGFGGGFGSRSSNNDGNNSGFGEGNAGFGGGNGQNAQATSFGSSNKGFAAAPAASSNPFGGTSIPAGNQLTFGTSNNVVMDSNRGTSFHSPPAASTSAWAAPVTADRMGSSSNNPFGTATANAPNSEFSNMQQQQHLQQSQTGGAAANPFGGSPSTAMGPSFSGMQPNQQGANPFEGSSSNAASSNYPTTQPKSNNKEWKKPTTSQSASSFLSSNRSAMTDEASQSIEPSTEEQEERLKAKMDEKKRLQAKIEEKKRKLLERTQKKKNQQKENNTLSASAVPFVPKGPMDDAAVERSSDKNRRSFREYQPDATNSKTRALMPQGLKATGVDLHTESGRDGREDLETAVSLVGTCQHMCPDDELLRREGENDIQLLEIPQPGTLHPPNWTLRNTVVKRFRRSAADYKLDVPEWVRPPDVLEKVCAYLEEWVMDRDRQGPDPRFPNNQSPQPLDVYQFIWNRTRMVRKDFTLQNFVGTGGNCDARAVRCHERIARWHAMCEHQLSHITDFAKMQSQQNIQELGQTMKTLNQFYDDALNRSLIEVPDEDGKETRLSFTKFSHGCLADKVCGKDPTDFDGSALNNTADGVSVAKRLLGKHAVGHPSHGTAEPEMRALYILLTINNDGGMEVLKYAGRLFYERPAVYRSRPVQLALNIYKAKKEFNYVRFFRIIRSSSTPYLFCCVMFKYVELMRKVAIRIMSKTYGARKKDTGETIYDSYPLQHLRDLLCYEDLDEAREACKHYNITVKPMKVPSSSDPSGSKVVEFIFWRKSDFKEPVHPEKGFNIPLQPRKMVRTIESKLKGATRLGVCRGEVSGEGAALAEIGVLNKSAISNTSTQIPPSMIRVTASPRDLSGEASSDSRKADLVLAEKEARRKADANRLAHEVEIKERSREAELERQQKAAEMQRVAEMEQIRQQRIEEAVRREEEPAAKRLKKEETRRKEIEDARRREEQRVLLEAEQHRRQLEEEEGRKRRELQDRRMREIEHLERVRQEEAAKKEREEAIENKRRRKEEQRARLERIARELEAKRLQEAEEKRKNKEWQDRLNAARKKLLLSRWRRRLSRGLELTQRSQKNLKLIDPTFSKDTLQLGASLQSAMTRGIHMSKEKRPLWPQNPRQILEDFLQSGSGKKLSLSKMALTEIESLPNSQYSRGDEADDKQTLLQKIGVVVPFDHDIGSICHLVRLWVSNCLDSGLVCSSSNGSSREVRSVVVLYKDISECSDCDVVLEIVLPGEVKRSSLSTGVVLVLDKQSPGSLSDFGKMGSLFHFYVQDLSVFGYQNALEAACKKIVELFVREAAIKIRRVSMFQLATTAIIKSIWVPISLQQNDEEAIVARSTDALLALAAEVEALFSANKSIWSTWPPREFTMSKTSIPKYFSETESLPVNWMASLGGLKFEDEMSQLFPAFNGNFRGVIRGLLGTGAPRFLQDESTSMVSKRQFRGCLERVLLWRQGQAQNNSSKYVYLPDGLFDLIMDGVIDRLRLQDELRGFEHSSALTLVPESGSMLAVVDSVSNRPDLQGVLPGDKIVGTQMGSTATEVARTQDQENILVLSNKRKMLQNSTLSSPYTFGSSPDEKRRRVSPTADLIESAAFSLKLESLVHGETVDFDVGRTSLSRILANATTILPGNAVEI